MPIVTLDWKCRQQVLNKGTIPLVPVEWDQGLSDGEEENTLEMESAYLYIYIYKICCIHDAYKDSMR